MYGWWFSIFTHRIVVATSTTASTTVPHAESEAHSCSSADGTLLLQLRSSDLPNAELTNREETSIDSLRISEDSGGGSVNQHLEKELLEASDALAFALNSEDPAEASDATDRIRFVWLRNPQAFDQEKNVDDHSETSSTSSGPNLAQTNMKTSKRVSYNGVPVVISNARGNFGGSEVFLDAIFKDLDAETVQRLNACVLGFKGDQYLPPSNLGNGKVWIIVNAEDLTGEAIARSVSSKIGPKDRVLALGNLWNNENKDMIVRDGRVTSIWVPFGSINFAERKHNTPMDLYDRSRNTFDGTKKGSVAYQQRNCDATLREHVFSELDEKLRMADLDPPSALATCHGFHEQQLTGYTNDNGVNCDDTCTNYDQSVGRYEEFSFVLSMEHEKKAHNTHGYITEKIVNAFLSGAIPISDDSAERAQVFRVESYIAVDATNSQALGDGIEQVVELLHDPAQYERMLDEPVLTEESLTKFFSWHPAVWPSHGDQLRRTIVDEVLKHCEASSGER